MFETDWFAHTVVVKFEFIDVLRMSATNRSARDACERQGWKHNCLPFLVRDDSNKSRESMSRAIRSGVKQLKYPLFDRSLRGSILFELDPEKSPLFVDHFLREGDAVVVSWLLDNGKMLSRNSIKDAMFSGHLNVVKTLHSAGRLTTFDSDDLRTIFRVRAMKGHQSVLEWLIQNYSRSDIYTMDDYTLRSLVQQNNLQCLKFIHSLLPDIVDVKAVMKIAIDNSLPDAVEWAYEHGTSCDSDSFYILINRHIMFKGDKYILDASFDILVFLCLRKGSFDAGTIDGNSICRALMKALVNGKSGALVPFEATFSSPRDDAIMSIENVISIAVNCHVETLERLYESFKDRFLPLNQLGTNKLVIAAHRSGRIGGAHFLCSKGLVPYLSFSLKNLLACHGGDLLDASPWRMSFACGDCHRDSRVKEWLEEFADHII
jgi:hypothetical protein